MDRLDGSNVGVPVFVRELHAEMPVPRRNGVLWRLVLVLKLALVVVSVGEW